MQDRSATFARALRGVDLAYLGGSFGRAIARHLATLAAALPKTSRFEFDRLREPASSLPDRQRLRSALQRPLRYALSRLRLAVESDAHWHHFSETLPASLPDRNDPCPPPLDELRERILAEPLASLLAYAPADLPLRTEHWRPGESVRTGVARPRRRYGVSAARGVVAWQAASWLAAEEPPMQLRAWECRINTGVTTWVEGITIRHARGRPQQPLALLHALGPPREPPFDRIAPGWHRLFEKFLARGQAQAQTPVVIACVGRPNARSAALTPATAAAVWDALSQIEGIDPISRPPTVGLLSDTRMFTSIEAPTWAGPILTANWRAAATLAGRQIRPLAASLDAMTQHPHPNIFLLSAEG